MTICFSSISRNLWGIKFFLFMSCLSSDKRSTKRDLPKSPISHRSRDNRVKLIGTVLNIWIIQISRQIWILSFSQLKFSLYYSQSLWQIVIIVPSFIIIHFLFNFFINCLFKLLFKLKSLEICISWWFKFFVYST